MWGASSISVFSLWKQVIANWSVIAVYTLLKCYLQRTGKMRPKRALSLGKSPAFLGCQGGHWSRRFGSAFPQQRLREPGLQLHFGLGLFKPLKGFIYISLSHYLSLLLLSLSFIDAESCTGSGWCRRWILNITFALATITEAQLGKQEQSNGLRGAQEDSDSVTSSPRLELCQGDAWEPNIASCFAPRSPLLSTASPLTRWPCLLGPHLPLLVNGWLHLSASPSSANPHNKGSFSLLISLSPTGLIYRT